MTLFRRIAAFTLAALCLAATSAQAATPPAPEPNYITPYNALLADHVQDGQKEGITAALVDYKGWSEDKNHAAAVGQLADMQPEKLEGNAAIAFWINAYNLLTIDLIVKHQEKETIRSIGTVLDDPWKTFHWNIGNRAMTLKQVEAKATEASHNDPRLHFALANGMLSGADLLMEAYTSASLDSQLDMQAMVFLKNDTKGLKRWGNILQVSPIFKRYTHEFETHGGLMQFLFAHYPGLPANAVIQGYFENNANLNGNW